MGRHDMVDEIAERLRAVVQAAPSTAIAEQAQRLISRLNSPVRVVLLGCPDAPKLELLNALAEGPALPEAARTVTVELRFGPVEAAEITFSDGSVVNHEGPLDDAALQGAALVVVERPFPVLKRTSILNLVASGDPREQKSAIAWAAKRTDIAVWCSVGFGGTDRAIWSDVPDRIRDHGFLVLTGSDDQRAAAVKAQHRDEFLDVYAVDLALDKAQSGVAELAAHIARHADLGRRADTDSAMLFLKAQAPRPQTRPRPNSRPLTKPRPNSRPLTRPRTEPLGAPQVAAPPPAPVAPQAATQARKSIAPAAPRALCGAGFGYLRGRGQALFTAIQSPEPPADAEILAHCSETLTHLTDLVTSHEDAGEAGALADTVMEAESLVILLENESGEDAAVDAVSILLQVRREFEIGLAA